MKYTRLRKTNIASFVSEAESRPKYTFGAGTKGRGRRKGEDDEGTNMIEIHYMYV
jgi:hypothetical protein